MEYREVSAHQKGGIGEALVTAHRYEIYDILGQWAVEDLNEHENEAVKSAEQIRVKMNELEDHATYHTGKDNEMSWIPDCRYRVIVSEEETRDSLPGFEPITTTVTTGTYEYLFEVKVGEYGSLKRDQKDVMQALEAVDDSIIPVRVRVDIDRLPDEYGIQLTRIHDRD